MLSEAKHLNESVRNTPTSGAVEIPRCAQDDTQDGRPAQNDTQDGCSAQGVALKKHADAPTMPPQTSTTALPPDVDLYSRQFFEVFAAVILFMTGVSLQFHIGKYIEFLGHGVDTLGWVLGIGMGGVLAIRLHVGRWIDRIGCRPVAVCGAVVTAVAVSAMQFTPNITIIVILRTMSQMSSATVMTVVAVYAALIAAPHRRAESLSIIGLAGFVGMIIGPAVGDEIFPQNGLTHGRFQLYFSLIALCSLVAAAVFLRMRVPVYADVRPSFTIDAMPKDARLASASGAAAFNQPVTSVFNLIRRHWPGTILFVGLVFSMVFCWNSSFLERTARARGFHDIKLYYLFYGPTAIVLRLMFRRLPEKLGRRRTLLLGSVLLISGVFFLIGIQRESQLILPGLLMGAGHCFIFPSMVDLAAGRFPHAHRGTGTAMILAAGDLGMLIGFSTLGEMIKTFGYDVPLYALIVLMAISTGLFAMRWNASTNIRPAAAP